jgi:CheY-like chemotaxis protein
MMPDMTGWQVIESLQNDPMTASIPIIVVSIVDHQPTQVSLGMAAHISKPVDRETLLNTIEQILHGRLIDPILVVDDNPEDLEVISISLRNAAYPVETCTGGKEALQWLEQQRPSLIVLDLLMPEVSGFDVLARIRETPTLCKLPVLIATAKDLTADEERFIQQRIATIVKKQGGAGTDLLAQIRSLLHESY